MKNNNTLHSQHYKGARGNITIFLENIYAEMGLKVTSKADGDSFLIKPKGT